MNIPMHANGWVLFGIVGWLLLCVFVGVTYWCLYVRNRATYMRASCVEVLPMHASGPPVLKPAGAMVSAEELRDLVPSAAEVARERTRMLEHMGRGPATIPIVNGSRGRLTFRIAEDSGITPPAVR
tara:strand:- start:735 stop:1112 length:378 start_codon:yes stop_codon:yes gene_type:complete